MNFLQNPAPVSAVQEGVLRPDHVKGSILERQVLEIPVNHLDQVVKSLLGVHFPVEIVFHLAQIQAGYVAAEAPRQVPGRTPEAGTYVEDPCLLTEFSDAVCHPVNRSPAGFEDGVIFCGRRSQGAGLHHPRCYSKNCGHPSLL